MLRRKRTAYDAETAVSKARAALREARFLRGGIGIERHWRAVHDINFATCGAILHDRTNLHFDTQMR
jgi:hypothetical protein